MVRAGGKAGQETRELTHDWEGFMACHRVGWICRLHRFCQWLADSLAKGPAAWWLRRHPASRPGEAPRHRR